MWLHFRKAIKSLEANKDIIIKHAENVGLTTIMDKRTYIVEAENLLEEFLTKNSPMIRRNISQQNYTFYLAI